MRIAAVIPAFNEEHNIAAVVEGVRPFVTATVVIDDGSADNTAGAARAAGAIVLCHESNVGKGAALKTGFRYLMDSGYDGAVTVLSLIHISEPTRLGMISYAVFCLKK